MARLTLVLITAALSAQLLVVGIPRLGANIAALPGDGAVALVHRGEYPSPQAFDRLFTTRERALAWHADPRFHLDRAAAHVTQAIMGESFNFSPDAAFSRARDELRRGLLTAPVDARSWFLLAGAESSLNNWPEAAKALHLSVVSEAFTPFIASRRVALALSGWDELPTGTKDLFLPGQLRYALMQAPLDTVLAASETGRLAELRQAALDRPAALRLLDETLVELEQPF